MAYEMKDACWEENILVCLLAVWAWSKRELIKFTSWLLMMCSNEGN